MKRINLDEIKQLLDVLIERDISVFELERGGEKISIKRGASNSLDQLPYVVVSSPNQTPSGTSSAVDEGHKSMSSGSSLEQDATPSDTSEEADSDNWTMVLAPIVGTFYEAASPGVPSFVKIGDRVEPGQVLCIIEAMKLMNEIEAEVGGVIMKRLVQNGQPVEFGESLFAIKPGA